MKIYPAFYNVLWDPANPKDTLTIRVEDYDKNVALEAEPVFISRTIDSQLQIFPCNTGAMLIDEKMGGLYSITVHYDKLADALKSCVTIKDDQQTILPAVRILAKPETKTTSGSVLAQEIVVPIVITNKQLLDEVRESVIADKSAPQLILKNLNCDSSFLFIKKDILCSVEVVNASTIPFKYEIAVNGIATFPWRSELDSKLISSGSFIFPKEQKKVSFDVPGGFFQSGPNIIGVKLAYTNQYLEVPLADAQGYQLFYISAIVLLIGILLGVYYLLTIARFLTKKFKIKFAALQNGRKTKVSSTKIITRRKRL